MKKRFMLLTILFCFFIFVSSFVIVRGQGVNVDLQHIKLSVKEGGSISKSFTIRGLEDSNVLVGSVNLMGFKFDEDSFFLAAGESKEINLNFSAKDISPGANVGQIVIKAGENYKRIPVIVEVESREIIFDLNLDVPPLYNEVSPGEPLLASVNVFDLTLAGGTQEGLSPENVEISYYIFREDGTAIVSETDNVVVSDKSSFTKSVMLSEDLADGTYFIVSMVKFGSSIGVSSATFNVVDKVGGIGALSLSWAVALFAVLGIIALFMFFFFLLVKDRDRFILALKEYHDEELQKQREFLVEQQKVLVKKGVPKKEVKKEARKKVKQLRNKQKERMRELRELSKSNDVGAMENKVKEWKKKGYNTELLESKLEKLSKKDMKSLIKEWKKKGYVPPKK